MKKDVIRALEEKYAKLECPVVSNNSAHRFTHRTFRWSFRKSTQITQRSFQHSASVWAPSAALSRLSPTAPFSPMFPALTALKDFGIEKVMVCTYQAISGAGKTFETWPEMVDNVIPYIGGEEEKSEKEPLKVWGTIEGDEIVSATEPVISAQCLRVPVSDGHTAAAFVKFKNKPTKEQILEAWANYSGRAAGAGAPVRTEAVPSLL